jgi:hypothetical protein
MLNLARNVGPGAGATRRHVDFSGIGFGICDEFRNRLGWNRWVHHHDERRAYDACDRRDVTDEIEIELVVERRVDRVPCANNEQRVAVGRGTHNRLGADIAAATRPVVDNKLLAEALRQPLTHQTREDVARTRRRQRGRPRAPAATGRLAPMPRATAPVARQRPRRDAENFGGEVSS